MKFNIKIGNLELRSTGEGLISTNKHDRAEIVKWENHNNCYTIARYDINGDNFSFIDDRPYDRGVDMLVFMKLVKIGFSLLRDKHLNPNLIDD